MGDEILAEVLELKPGLNVDLGIFTDFEIKNSQKGQKVGFYCYSPEKTVYFETNVPHCYYSRRIESSVAIDYKNRIERNLGSKVSVKRERSGTKDVLKIHGDRGILDEIKDITGQVYERVSSPQVVLQNYPLYSKLSITNGEVKITGKATLEELLSFPTMNLDIEKRKSAGKGYDQTFLEAIKTKVGGNYFSELIVLEKYNPGLIDDVDIVVCNDQDDFGSETKAEIRKRNPFSVLGQNSFNFDFDHLGIGIIKSSIATASEDEPDKGVVVDEDNRFKLQRMIIKGRQTGDTYRFAQTWRLPTVNYKLEQLCNFFDIPFEKDRTYEAMQALTDHPTPEGNLGNAIYNLKDVDVQLELSEKMLKSALTIAHAYGVSLSEVCTQRSELARKYRDKKGFRDLKTKRIDYSGMLSVFDYQRKRNSFFSDLGFEKGYFKSDMKIVYPLIGINNLCLKSEPEMEDLKKMAFSETNSPTERLFLLRGIEAYCEEPLLDLDRWKNGKIKDTLFRIIYRKDPRDVLNSLENEAKGVELNLLNHNNDLYIVPDNFKLNGKFMEITTVDRLISKGKGSFIARTNGKIIAPGISLTGNKGFKTDFEKETIHEFSKILFDQGHKEAMRYVEERKTKLEKGCINPDDLKYTIKRKRHVYTASAQKTRRVRAMIDNGLRTGEIVEHRLDNKQDYMKAFFGKRGTITSFVNFTKGGAKKVRPIRTRSSTLDSWC